MLLLNLTTLDKNNENFLKTFISLWRLNHSNEAPNGVLLPAHFHDVNYDHIWSEILQELTEPRTKYEQEQYTRAILQH